MRARRRCHAAAPDPSPYDGAATHTAVPPGAVRSHRNNYCIVHWYYIVSAQALKYNTIHMACGGHSSLTARVQVHAIVQGNLYTATCRHACVWYHVARVQVRAQCFHHGGSVSRRRSDGKPPEPVLE